MSFFSDLKDKIFGSSAEDTVTETVTTEAEATPEAAVETEAVASIDIGAFLDAKAASNSEALDWKTSIVDLLKLVDMDSSYGARKELASDVGIEGYEGTAENNIALHKAVLVKLAENGGTVPSELI